MVEAKLYLDTRRLDKEGRAQIRIRISKNGKSAMLSTGVSISPNHWKNNAIVNHPNMFLLNSILTCKMAAANRLIIERTASGSLTGMSAKEIMESIKEELDPEYAERMDKARKSETEERESFLRYFNEYMTKIENKGTKTLYSDTYKKILRFCSDNNVAPRSLRFVDITREWLANFEAFCLTTQAQNTASRHLRDIRAVINNAIDNGRCENYPFRKFRIKKAESQDKSYSSDELRKLFNYSPYPGGEEEAVDIFKLMFLLIGINSVDLANAGPVARGRLQYKRQKTGKLYSIKIEPEAMAIIEKYKGKDHLINIIERVPNYKTYFNRIAKTLRKIGKQRVSGRKSIGESLLPNICTGSARTSWATIAQEELDIPRDVIAAALGHHTIDVTSTYLRTDWKNKVDKANRMVIDWVFYQKRSVNQ